MEIQVIIFGMCGRIFQTLPLSRLLQIARTSKVSNSEHHSASYNVCPTTYIPVIKRSQLYPDEPKHEAKIENREEEREEREQREEREVSFMKWGHKTNMNMIINGRIEELTEKRTFVKMIENRCVVIMEGYYEWKSKEQPFSFKPKEGDHFLVAGLYSENGEIIILTKDAVAPLNKVHERMPVMLTSSEVELWLDPKNTKDINNIIHRSLLDVNKPLWKNVGFAEVAPYVNKRDNKSVKCLMTVEEYKKELDRTGLMRFWKKKEPVEAVGRDGETLTQKNALANAEPPIAPERKGLMEADVGGRGEPSEEDHEKIEDKEGSGERNGDGNDGA